LGSKLVLLNSYSIFFSRQLVFADTTFKTISIERSKVGAASGRCDAAEPLVQRKRRRRDTAAWCSVDARGGRSSGWNYLWSPTPLTPFMINRLSKGGKKLWLLVRFYLHTTTISHPSSQWVVCGCFGGNLGWEIPTYHMYLLYHTLFCAGPR
jgi:hypothetical protein